MPRPETGKGSGPGSALLIGNEIKKDISMLEAKLLSWIPLKRSFRVRCSNFTDGIKVKVNHKTISYLH